MDCSLLPQHILLWQSGQFDRYHITAWGEGGGGGGARRDFQGGVSKELACSMWNFQGLIKN